MGVYEFTNIEIRAPSAGRGRASLAPYDQLPSCNRVNAIQRRTSESPRRTDARTSRWVDGLRRSPLAAKDSVWVGRRSSVSGHAAFMAAVRVAPASPSSPRAANAATVLSQTSYLVELLDLLCHLLTTTDILNESPRALWKVGCSVRCRLVVRASLMNIYTSLRYMGPIPHDASYYSKCMFGGALACGLTHAALTPLDVTKCNMQVCLVL